MRSMVCTPKGWRRIGDLKVGDSVTDPTNGGATRVIGIFPQGEQDIYRVTCDDGGSCEVGLEHLWAYRLANHVKPRTKASSERQFAVDTLGAVMPTGRWNDLRVGTTADVIRALEKKHGVRIPLTEPVMFTVNGRGGSGPIDPYLAGVVLGDGHIGSFTVTACDDGVRETLAGFGFRPQGELHTDGKPKAWAATGACRKSLREWFGNHGLSARHSWDKFVPPYVLTAGLEYRLSFLQGLMDTDGTVDDRGRCYFTSTSKELAEGVRHIVRSLGGKASSRERITRYTHKGEKKDGRPSWTIRIWMRKTSVLFRLQRKKDRCTDSWNGGAELTREIVSVEKVGREQAVCIRVDSPHSLYLTDDFIVTHNTHALIGDAAIRAGRYGKDFRGLFIRRQQTELADVKMKMTEVYSPIGAKWSEQHQTWTFPGGGTLVLKYLMNDDDALMYKGWGITALYVDEIGDFGSKRAIDLLWGAMRSARGVPVVRRMSANPGGPGHLWVKQMYLSHGKYRVFRYTPNPELPDLTIDAVFIPSKLEDNKILMANDPLYEARLSAACGGDMVLYRAWREGDWDGLAGAYFAFDEKVHVAVPPPIPPYLQRWMAIDWGYTHPTAVLWGVDFGDRAYIYRERTYTNTEPVSLGMFIAEVNGDDPISNVYLSPDAFAKRTSVNTIASELEEGFRRAHEMKGMALIPSPEMAFNDRVNGWQILAAGLAQGRLLVSPSCTELIRTLPSMVRDPRKPNDVQKVDGDDVCLAAGTLVRMADGTEKAIETVRAGDMVATPCGPGHVSWAGQTGADEELAELVFEDGRRLRGTPGHHLFDEEGREREIGELLPGDTIAVWPYQSALSLTESSTVATLTPKAEPSASTSCQGPGTDADTGLAPSTRRSGSRPTGPSPLGAISTTPTKTHKTTPSRTSSASRRRSIARSTGQEPALSQQNGTGPRPGASGTDFTRKASDSGRPGRTRFGRTAPLAGPASTMSLGINRSGSAQTLASRRGAGVPGPTMSSGPAFVAGRLSVPTDTLPFATARVVAVRRLTETASVYNLTVDCCHRYYANGILSRNCDCARYLWATRNRGQQLNLPMETRAAQVVTAVDPNFRAMQERRFLSQEAAAGGDGSGVTIRGRRRFFSGHSGYE